MPGPRSSRCSGGGVLGFYWYGDPLNDHLDAVQAACLAFAEMMKPPGRIWNPYSWAATKAEFQDRIEQAMLGELIPVDHVKDIVRGDPESLYEIRWEFTVLSVRPAGPPVEELIQVRMYHTEPSRFPTSFVGLHVHQKAIVRDDDDRTQDLQNAEIDKAIVRYDAGSPHDWGIS